MSLSAKKTAKAAPAVDTSSPADSLAHTAEDVAAAGRNTAFTPMVLCPLHNLGNTCYFNSGVQMMCNCPSLLYTLRDSAFTHKDKHLVQRAETLGYTGGQSSHALFSTISQLLSQMQYGELTEGDAIRPTAQLDALAQVNPTFEGRSQQDCCEFLNTVLSTIEDEGRISIQLEQLLASFTRAEPLKTLSSHGTRQTMSTAAEGDAENCFTPPEGGSISGICAMGAAYKSAHTYALLQLMQDVNVANEGLERKVAQRKQTSYNNTFQPPRLFYNSVSDAFKGYSLSTIRCHGCQATSRVVEPFTSLMIDLPTSHQRAEFARRHPEIHRVGPDGQPLTRKKTPSTFVWWNPLTYFTTLFRKLRDLCACAGSHRYPLTLQECLDIHFEADSLHGSNKYKCDACGCECVGTKQETLVDLPEYLQLQMKRFKAGACFNSKKTDPVIFPMSWSPLSPQEADGSKKCASPEVLDLYRYVDPSMAPYVVPLPPRMVKTLGRDQSLATSPGTSNPVRLSDASAHAPDTSMSPVDTSGGRTPGQVPQQPSLTSTYTLEAMVVHHGSYGGGHYTVYVRKLDRGRERWIYISDDSLEPVEVDEVADNEEYILMYRKQSVVERTAADLELRNLARLHLLRAGAARPTETVNDNAVYVARTWLHRMALMTDPGPIINGLCYCSERDKARVTGHYSLFPSTTRVPEEAPHVHGPPAEWYYVPVSQEDYDRFHAAYGGDAAVTPETVRSIMQDQDRFVGLVAQKKRNVKH